MYLPSPWYLSTVYRLDCHQLQSSIIVILPRPQPLNPELRNQPANLGVTCTFSKATPISSTEVKEGISRLPTLSATPKSPLSLSLVSSYGPPQSFYPYFLLPVLSSASSHCSSLSQFLHIAPLFSFCRLPFTFYLRSFITYMILMYKTTPYPLLFDYYFYLLVYCYLLVYGVSISLLC